MIQWEAAATLVAVYPRWLDAYVALLAMYICRTFLGGAGLAELTVLVGLGHALVALVTPPAHNSHPPQHVHCCTLLVNDAIGTCSRRRKERKRDVAVCC